MRSIEYSNGTQQPTLQGACLLTNQSVLADQRSWFVLYTASNHEKRIAQYLECKNIETFLPVYTATKRRKNRTTVKLELPLFANYVFVRIKRSERTKTLAAPMVYSIVGTRSESLPVPDSDIETLQKRLQGRQVQPFPYLTSGNRVRIRQGALAGIEGIVVRTYGSLSVVLNVEMIQRSIAIHVEADELEPCARNTNSLAACA